MQAQQAEQASCGAEVHAGGRVAVLVLTLTLGLLAEDPLKARGAEAALVVVAGAPVLAQQELVIADICCGKRGKLWSGCFGYIFHTPEHLDEADCGYKHKNSLDRSLPPCKELVPNLVTFPHCRMQQTAVAGKQHTAMAFHIGLGITSGQPLAFIES